jgi:uncharacterized membrane protein YccC
MLAASCVIQRLSENRRAAALRSRSGFRQLSHVLSHSRACLRALPRSATISKATRDFVRVQARASSSCRKAENSGGRRAGKAPKPKRVSSYCAYRLTADIDS